MKAIEEAVASALIEASTDVDDASGSAPSVEQHMDVGGKGSASSLGALVVASASQPTVATPGVPPRLPPRASIAGAVADAV